MMTSSRSTPARLTAPATDKLPRVLLLALLVLYIVAGLFGRDPWKIDDVASLASMLSALQYGYAAWLLPQVGPSILADGGPIVTWVGASLIYLLDPWLSPITTYRFTNLLWFGLMAWTLWYGAYLLGRRPETQPLALPFGGEPSEKDYGRMLADVALLLLLGTAGILVKIHEVSDLPAALAWQAIALCAVARMVDKPKLGSTFLGLALAGMFLTRGWPGIAPILLALLIIFIPNGPLARTRTWLAWSLLIASLLVMVWWWPASQIPGSWMTHFIHWNQTYYGLPRADALLWPFRDLPWFLWPTWPLAMIAIWKWRAWILSPHLLIPVSFAASVLLTLFLTEDAGDIDFAMLVIPIAMLAAFSLPTLRRGLINTLDWFSLMCFSLTVLTVWLGWLSLHFKVLPQVHQNIMRLTAGYIPEIQWWAVITGVLVTAGWVIMIIWRVKANPTALWRGAALCATGITATWVLLVLLWMPAVDYVRSYRPMSAQVQEAIDRFKAESLTSPCIRAQGLSLGTRASLYVFDGITFSYESSCPLVLQQTTVRQLRDGSAGYSEGTTVLWQGSRAADRFDRYRLLRIDSK